MKRRKTSVSMRAFLSELGCLPVSAMLHFPKAQEVFDESGDYLESVSDADRWDSYFNRTFLQLRWWCEASLKQRDAQGSSSAHQ